MKNGRILVVNYVNFYRIYSKKTGREKTLKLLLFTKTRPVNCCAQKCCSGIEDDLYRNCFKQIAQSSKISEMFYKHLIV